jgi:hypothetical protein
VVICIYGHETGNRLRGCIVWVGLVASNHLRTFVFVSGEPVSEAHIRTTGVGPDPEDHES